VALNYQQFKESDKFDEPLFTPSTKADSGHDIIFLLMK